MLAPQPHAPTMAAGGPDHAPAPARRGGPALTLAIAALLLKLPQAVLSLAAPAEIAGQIPSGGTVIGVTFGLIWVAFTVVTLGLRRWIGAISAVWFAVVSGLSGAGFLADGYLAWGGAQVVTAAVALVAVIVATVLGAFRGSRW